MFLKRFYKLFFIFLFTSFFALCTGESVKQKTEEEIVIQKSADMYHSLDWSIRLEGITALEKSPRQNAWHPDNKKNIIIFLEGATEDIHTAVRIEAIKQLAAYLYDTGVIECLEEISLNDENNNVRWTALNVLLESPSQKTVNVFITNFASSDILLKETSIKGILTLSGESLSQDMLPYVLSALNDEAINVRIAALDSLTFKDEAIYQILAKNLQTAQLSVTMLNLHLKAINGYKLDKETHEKILPLLTHSDADIRVLALRALKNSQNQ